MSTIKDVARLAGVSTATVSRTLAEPEKVTPETRSKVQAAIRQSGYVRNELARSFRMQSTRTILVLFPNIGDPFYSAIIQGLDEVAQQHGYRLLLGDTQEDPQRESEYLDSVHRQVDGVISLCHTLPQLRTRRGEKAVPVVMVSECLYAQKITLISIDNVAAARDATEHLLGLGHSRIAFIAGPASKPVSEDRFRGYREALKAAGVTYDARLVVRGDFSLASGERAAHELLQRDESFTALFSSNDFMAVGAIHALRRRGRRIPDDLSVVGFDDIAIAPYTEPPLTTIHQPRREMGRTAMQKMIEALGRTRPASERVQLPHTLVVRESAKVCT